jgi:hypothetical protein
VPDVKTLYDEDFLAWSEQQAEALRNAVRAGSNLALDWKNLAEEIEDLGNSQKSALHSQVRRIIQHFLKLEYSPASDPRRGWRDSIANARTEIDYLLGVSPSLRHHVDAAIAEETKRAVGIVLRDLETYGEINPVGARRMRSANYTVEQILGDWFPPEPAPAQ